MSVRLVYFNLGPGRHKAAEALAEEIGPLIRSQPGCGSATFFGDDTDGQHGIFVLWDTQAHADAAAGVVGPGLERHLAGKVTTNSTAACSKSSARPDNSCTREY